MPRFNFAAMMAEAGGKEPEAVSVEVPPTNAEPVDPLPTEEVLPETATNEAVAASKKRKRLVKQGRRAAASKEKSRPEKLEAINDGSSGSEGDLDEVSPYIQSWVDQVGNPSVKDNRVAALLSSEISFPADMEGLAGRTHNSLALQLQENLLSSLNLVRVMKFKQQAKRSALKNAVKDVKTQIQSAVAKATEGAEVELKKAQERANRIKEKADKQKADLEAQILDLTEKADQLSKENEDLKANAEPLQKRVADLEEEGALLRRSVGGTLIKYRAKLRQAAQQHFPNSDFSFLNAIYPDEDDE